MLSSSKNCNYFTVFQDWIKNKEKTMKKEIFDPSWKNKNKNYLCEMQKFLDKVDNIKDEDLKQEIIHQMLRCDSVLTSLSYEMFNYYYQKGLSHQEHV